MFAYPDFAPFSSAAWRARQSGCSTVLLSGTFLHFQQRSTALQLDRASSFDLQAACNCVESVLLKLEHRADFTGSGWTTNPTAHKYEEKNLVD